MKTSHFKTAIGISLALIVASIVIQAPFIRFMLAIFSAAPVFQYYRAVRRFQPMTSDSVDSVYYLGFLVTIMTLIASAVSLALDKGPPQLSSIVMHFASGLAVTALALFLRIMLLAEMPSESDEEAMATAKLVAGTEELADHLARASSAMSGFLGRAQEEMEALEQRLVAQRTMVQSSVATMDAAFRETLRSNSEMLRDSVLRSAEEAQARAMTTITTAAQEFELKLAKAMEALDKAGRDAGKFDLSPLLENVRALSANARAALETTAAASTSASKSTAEAIGELTSASRKTLLLATKISSSLESLHSLEEMSQTIVTASERLRKLGESAATTEARLARLNSPATASYGLPVISSESNASVAIGGLASPITPAHGPTGVRGPLETLPPIPVLVPKAPDDSRSEQVPR